MPDARLLARTALVLLTAAGCQREPERRAPRALSPLARQALALLPSDASIVFGVDLARLRRSDAWRRDEAAVRAHAPAIALELRSVCAIDVLGTGSWALFSADADLTSPLVALAGVGTAEAARCAGQLAGARGDRIEIGEAAGIASYRTRRPRDTVFARWIAPDTALYAFHLPSDAPPTARLATAPRLGSDGALTTTLGETDTGAVLWGAGPIPRPALAALRQLGYVPLRFSVSIDLAPSSGAVAAEDPPADIVVDLALRYEDADAARSSSRLLAAILGHLIERPPRPAIEPVARRARVELEGESVRIGFALTLAQAAELVPLALARARALGL